ncbi:MAG: hypothetical protein ACNI25_11510 [Halarcobacter sp.]
MNIKKVLGIVTFSTFACISLNADYKLVLTDVDGNQTQECIKSYSFSNNLESLVKQNGVGKDIYSEEEVMTNKVYMGKPIYRKIVKVPSNLIADHNWRIAYYINPAKNIEKLISARQVGIENLGATSQRGDEYDMYYVFYDTYMGYYLGSARTEAFNGADIVLEYTKTTDVADSSSNTFKSYLHYVPSSSTTEEVITKDIKDLGLQFLEEYSYNPDTLSCDKIQ